jgi:predicted acyl esterase
MGANLWRHAPSLAAMGNRTLHLHPSGRKNGGARLLTEDAPAQTASIEQSINLADRSDADRVPPGGNILDPVIDTWLSLEFVSAPFAGPVEVSGLFSGTLRFVTNKKDFDFDIQLYEQMPDRRYLQLGSYLARASYVADAAHRHLLVPNRLQQLTFRSGRLSVAKFARGSRLVVILSAMRQPTAEINYGTGKDVGRETIADARTPLDIKWLSSSVIDIPVRR